jgi:hypothetical protein
MSRRRLQYTKTAVFTSKETLLPLPPKYAARNAAFLDFSVRPTAMGPENLSLESNIARNAPLLTNHIMISMAKHFNLRVLVEARRRKTWLILSNRRKAHPPEVKTLLRLHHLQGKVHRNLYRSPTLSVNIVDSSCPLDV